MAMQYIARKHIGVRGIDRELKKGSAELLILSLIEHRARHSYEIENDVGLALLETRN
jgi:hypothetical protein